MPIEWLWEERGLYRRYHGVLTAHLLNATRRLLYDDARFDSLRYLINDYSEVTISPDIGALEVSIEAAYVGAAALSNPNIRIASVTRDPNVVTLLAQFQGTGLSPYPFRIFPTLEEARQWAEHGE